MCRLYTKISFFGLSKCSVALMLWVYISWLCWCVVQVPYVLYCEYFSHACKEVCCRSLLLVWWCSSLWLARIALMNWVVATFSLFCNTRFRVLLCKLVLVQNVYLHLCVWIWLINRLYMKRCTHCLVELGCRWKGWALKERLMELCW